MIAPVTASATPARRGPAARPGATDHASAPPAATDSANRKLSGSDDADVAATERQLATLARTQRKFNWMVMQQSEAQREEEALDTLFMAQLKHDGEILKEWLRLSG